MEGTLPAFVQSKRRIERRDSPLTRFNTALAHPIAAFFRVLGFAPGQLSVQSLTVTIVGLVQMADGTWTHMATGAATIYFALLLDRADALIAQRHGKTGPWTVFLGLAVDRLVDLSLIVGLGILTVRGVQDAPIPAWAALSTGWVLVLGTATAGLLMCVKALGAYSDLHLLRHHLLTTRRLPGPSAIPRTREARAIIEPLFGRDETILVWCAGVILGQLELTLIVLATAQLLLLVERIVLFRLRLRDPEMDAIRVMGTSFP